MKKMQINLWKKKKKKNSRRIRNDKGRPGTVAELDLLVPTNPDHART